MFSPKITGSHLKSDRKLESKSDKNLKKKVSKGGIFQRMMTHRVEEVSRPLSKENYRLEDMIEELEIYEEKLLSLPDIENFNSYKNHVKEIARKIVDKAFLYKSFRDKKQKRYEFIKVIDENLNDLLKTITRRNKEVVIMLHLMGQIKGLILDVSA
ncbi:MAG: YaaR family protein [Spirochaetia bacterium]|nr:YaaR family protein [Spirochaetia bacterium]